MATRKEVFISATSAEEVDHLPLALELVVSYMHETNQSAAEWLEEWHKTPDLTIKHYDSDNVNYPVSLARVWEQSVGRLSHSARELMHWLVWMAARPAGFPIEVFKTSADWLSLRAALSELAKASLIGWPPAADEISIHRVLQAVTRNHLGEQEKTTSLDDALAIINTALPSPEWDQKGWQLWEQLAPHCRNLLNRLQDHVLEPKATRIMNDLALWLNNRAEHGEAETLIRRALAIDEKSFGPEHPNVAIRLNNLAELLRATNRLAEAEPLYRRALAIDEKSFGSEHSEVATGLHNLAELLSDTNRLAEAEPLYRRALAIYEKSFGPEHPNVAIGLNSLATLLSATNRLAEAEPLYRRALAIGEKSFGPEHPNVAIRLNNLAELLSATNRLAEAEPLYHRALAIYEMSFGPVHPDVAIRLNNLAGLLSATNRLAEAEPLFRRALRILAVFGHRTGHEHPHFRTAIDNYAGLISVMGLSQDDAIAARARSAIEGEPEESA